eukprot:g6207.t1
MEAPRPRETQTTLLIPYPETTLQRMPYIQTTPRIPYPGTTSRTPYPKTNPQMPYLETIPRTPYLETIPRMPYLKTPPRIPCRKPSPRIDTLPRAHSNGRGLGAWFLPSFLFLSCSWSLVLCLLLRASVPFGIGVEIPSPSLVCCMVKKN